MGTPVSKHAKYVPKHRHAASRTVARDTPKRVLRSTVLFSSVAVAATGVVVSGGVLQAPVSVSSAATELGTFTAAPLPASRLAERAEEVTTSQVKEAALAQPEGPAITRTEDLSDDDPRDIARALLGEFGFSQDQFPCLDSLYIGESDWRVDADNPTSSAYGIPQALPGEKMASAGADWATNPETQIRWGLGYIRDRYGSPCSANAFKSANNWY